ncbi:DUF305 domain-containing protein [Saccharopolyspora erythraea]|uniref:DUF305 domain-containing protein n=1 Tax=Saccharopolyspora erythraea TaxID=1836 RepID=UPI001BA5EA78|nr:DUF305 domain-containing protein [Saccharopolyspora erythraea]QUH00706.1 DUF305 domain-containing protein [Saccharopolyspora erythraea]
MQLGATARRLGTGAAAVFAVVLAAGLLGACSTPEPPQAPVVLPGAPGDEPKVATGEEVQGLGRSAPPGEAEATYVAMMIPHHEQALEMTALAPERAQHPQVRALAERIGGAQKPEIDMMRGWQASHGAQEHAGHGGQPGQAGHGGHVGGPETGHAAMPGMATPAQLAELAAARGDDFDRLFLRLMTAHHEGAVTMATDLLTRGLDEQVHAMAQDVLVTQSDEIATMRALSAEVG